MHLHLLLLSVIHVAFSQNIPTCCAVIHHAEPPSRMITRSIVLDGKFEEIITGARMYLKFLQECTRSLSSGGRTVECVDLRPGSIIVDLRGSEDAVDSAVLEVAIIGLNLPSFPRLRAAGSGE